MFINIKVVNIEKDFLKDIDPVWKYEDEEWNLYSNLGCKVTTSSSKTNTDNNMFYKNPTSFSKGTIIFTP